jgi:hypothetical protein
MNPLILLELIKYLPDIVTGVEKMTGYGQGEKVATGPEKLQIAVDLAMKALPAVEDLMNLKPETKTTVETLISTVVSVMNIFGLLKPPVVEVNVSTGKV